MLWDKSIESLPRTSIATINRLKKLEIKNYFGLLNYFPFRYENYSLISPLSHIQEGETVTVIGKVTSAKNNYVRRSFTIQKIKLEDETGSIDLTWYNQPYLIKLFQNAPFLAVSGLVKKNILKLTIDPKEYEILLDNKQKTIHTGRIIPIYPEKKGLSSRTIREKVFLILQNNIDNIEFLPNKFLTLFDLVKEETAYKQVHFPENLIQVREARERLGFDEFFIIQLASALIKKEWQEEKVGHPFEVKEFKKKIALFIKNLPFKLTADQEKVSADILKDFNETYPMNKFLQGEVGSGKTVVAAIACYLAYLNGFQSLFMAPTEILAQQHFKTLSNLFAQSSLKIGLQTSSVKLKDPTKFNLIAGTHALLNIKLSFSKVGFVVIDEQHRFGVQQRAKLKEKGINPHLLTMTATPIPRTTALTLYGELNISTISQMPKGRIQIKSYLVPRNKRRDMYRWISKKVKEGDQVFFICPLIEESEIETMKQVKAANREFETLSKKIFPKLSVGLLHGKMKAAEKEKIMTDFKNKKFDILVSTAVVEVGIDIPNATIMVIETAERYGLAQLHQLRGRVGRGNKQSYCLVFLETESQSSLQRLSYFIRNLNGAKLAQYDLETRGPGEVYGTAQHGFKQLKIASLTDYNLIEKAQKAVGFFINKYKNLNEFPKLEDRIKAYRLDLISRD